jgi:hypothetical protein
MDSSKTSSASSGTYRGHTYSVSKDGKEWTAVAGELRATSQTRKGAIESIKRQIDCAEVDLPPGFHAMLQTWAKRVETVAARLDPRDTGAIFKLSLIKRNFETL